MLVPTHEIAQVSRVHRETVHVKVRQARVLLEREQEDGRRVLGGTPSPAQVQEDERTVSRNCSRNWLTIARGPTAIATTTGLTLHVANHNCNRHWLNMARGRLQLHPQLG